MADASPQVNGRLPAWSIYAQQLFHHRYGYPLWMPEYDPRLGEVEIGDVGWINEGGFYPLFNTLKSIDEPQPRGVVPEGHESMNVSSLIISDPRQIVTQPLLCGGSIKQVKASATVTASGGFAALNSPSAGVHFGFECSTDAGAFLLLAPPAVSRQIQSKKHIADYMRKNFPQWFELANSQFGLGLKDEEILYVSGTTKTTRWAVAAFHGEYRRKEGSITADFGALAGIDISVSISDEMLPSSYYRTGPAREPAPGSLVPSNNDSNEPVLSAPVPQERCDQCIFLHYYKMKRRLGWKPTPIQAAGGPHELPPPDPDGGDDAVPVPYEDAENAPVSDEAFFKPYDPVNDILDYILEHSEASMALASDADVYELLPDIPYNMSDVLLQTRPRIEVDENEVGCLSTEQPLDRLLGHDPHPIYDPSSNVDQDHYYRMRHCASDGASPLAHRPASGTAQVTGDKAPPREDDPSVFEASFEALQGILQRRFYNDALRWRPGVTILRNPNQLRPTYSWVGSNKEHPEFPLDSTILPFSRRVNTYMRSHSREVHVVHAQIPHPAPYACEILYAN